MFKVTIKNGDQETVINDNRERLLTGQIKNGTNDISSFVFSILPDNAGYNLINPVTTRIKVERTDINKILFQGRVWKPKAVMSDSGAFTKEFTCNDSLDFLHDIYPGYSTYTGTLRDIAGALLDFYNSLVEDYKKIYLGDVTSGNQLTLKTSAEKDLYDTIHEFVVTNLGYDHALRIENDKQYLDIAPTLGKQINNPIQIAKNLQSLSIEDDPSSLITRVIPLGAVKETNGEVKEDDVQERVNLTDIGKKIYVDSPDLISKYGVQMGVMAYDSIKDANQLQAKADSYLKNQSITRGFTVNTLDLSFIDKQVSDFECYNSYPIINPVMGLNEYLRVIDQTIDIINPQNAELGFGNKFKKASGYTLDGLNVVREAKQLKSTVTSLSQQTTAATKQSEQALQTANSMSETVKKLETDIDNANLSGIAADIASLKSDINQQSQNIIKLGTDTKSLQDFKTQQLAINTSQQTTNEAQAVTNEDLLKRIEILEQGGHTSGE